MLRVYSFSFRTCSAMMRAAAFVAAHVPHDGGKLEVYSGPAWQITFAARPGDALNFSYFLLDNGIENIALIPGGLPVENSTWNK